jgi:HEPN domain-containing protein
LVAGSCKDKVIAEWLSASTTDLESAKVLYDHRLFSNSLYHLQQSNEKLAKALLLSIGFLTPKFAKKDLRIKELLGFLPK